MGLYRMHLPGQFEAIVRTRRADVGEQDTNVRALRDERERLDAPVGLHGFASRILQRLDNPHPDQDRVLDDEHDQRSEE